SPVRKGVAAVRTGGNCDIGSVRKSPAAAGGSTSRGGSVHRDCDARGDLRNKGIVVTAAGRLEDPGSSGKIGRKRGTGDVSATGAIHCNAIALIRIVATEIGRINKACARRIKLSHKRVLATTINCLEGSSGSGKIGRVCGSRNPGVARSVHS